jgi:hypothetical protein
LLKIKYAYFAHIEKSSKPGQDRALWAPTLFLILTLWYFGISIGTLSAINSSMKWIYIFFYFISALSTLVHPCPPLVHPNYGNYSKTVILSGSCPPCPPFEVVYNIYKWMDGWIYILLKISIFPSIHLNTTGWYRLKKGFFFRNVSQFVTRNVFFHFLAVPACINFFSRQGGQGGQDSLRITVLPTISVVRWTRGGQGWTRVINMYFFTVFIKKHFLVIQFFEIRIFIFFRFLVRECYISCSSARK